MFHKFPFVKQEEYKDCGPTCLLMIIRYYKGNVGIDYLRDLTKTNRYGTSAYNLIQACNEIGFSACGMQGDINSLDEVLLPCIAHVIIDNSYKHYIVIYKIDFLKKMMIIADPSKGICKISFDDFNKIWTGVIITLYPVRTLPITKNINITQFIYNIICNYKKDVFFMLVLSLFVIFLKLFSSFYFKFLIDGIDVSKNYLMSIFMIFTLLSFTKLVINYLRNRFLISMNLKLDLSLTLDSFKHVILLPYHYYHNRTTGEVISKINDLSIIRDTFSKICVNLFMDIPILIISVIFLIRINWSLFLVTFFVFLLYLLLTLLYNKIFYKYISKIKTNKEIVNSYMYETISGFETVKGINISDMVINKFNKKYVLFLNDIFKLQNHINNQSFFKDLINDIGNAFILILGCLLVFDGKLDLGLLITYSSIMVYFLEPIRNIIDIDVDIKECRDSINRVVSLYEKNEVDGITDFKNGDISISNLTYSFDNSRNILNNISVDIKKGSKIMLIGNSGSGKSTLLKLIMKYYDVPRGKISINNIDINDYRTSSIRENITYISQSEILFNGTLLENLNFYDSSNDIILDMAKLVEFREILDNNLGFNMLIEENGFNLSGGQRQRIVLARSLLKNSDIILIDEGLNQIDVLLERKILENVFEYYKDKTFIIVSHRMDNLDLYDNVIKIEEGQVV